MMRSGGKTSMWAGYLLLVIGNWSVATMPLRCVQTHHNRYLLAGAVKGQ